MNKRKPITLDELKQIESDLFNYWTEENPRCELIADLIDSLHHWQSRTAEWEGRCEFWRTYQINKGVDVRDLQHFAERFLPVDVWVDLGFASTCYSWFVRLKEHLKSGG